jgi:Uri superfamily endonuclease
VSAVTILNVDLNNDQAESGAYVLRMGVAAPLSLSFGRFEGGRLIAVPAGEALYVGSAMGKRGSSTLARRLLRHATRTGSQPPHALRNELLARLQDANMRGTQLSPPVTKTSRWHIDYLLDQPAVELTQILAIRSIERLETPIAQRLIADPHTAIIVPGLGASDAPGATHLLHLHAAPNWWAETINDLSNLLPTAS